MKYGKYWGIVFLLLCILLPLLIGNASLSFIMVNVPLTITAAIAWSIFSGYTGYISLGHATYYGIGAYVLALMCKNWNVSGGYEPFLLLPVVGVIVGAFAIPLGWIALHTRRYTFMITTIAIFFIFRLLASNLHDLTNGSSGLFLPIPTWSVDYFILPFYYSALVVLVLTLLVAWKIRSSRFGLVLRAIRDDEERAASLGIQILWYKLLAYVLSAALIGMVGALAIYFTGFISPSTAFDQTLDIIIVTITFFGGVESLLGPLVGGLILEPLQFYLSQQYGTGAADINQIIFGCFLLIVIIFLPRGIVPSLRNHWSTWRNWRTLLGASPVLAPIDIVSSTVPSLTFDSSRITLEDSPRNELVQKHVVMSIPHRPLKQTLALSPSLASTQKIRSQRLVSMPSRETMTSQDRVTVSSVGQWRCSICRKPFLLKGNICYCPRCGTTRSLTPATDFNAKSD